MQYPRFLLDNTPASPTFKEWRVMFSPTEVVRGFKSLDAATRYWCTEDLRRQLAARAK